MLCSASRKCFLPVVSKTKSHTNATDRRFGRQRVFNASLVFHRGNMLGLSLFLLLPLSLFLSVHLSRFSDPKESACLVGGTRQLPTCSQGKFVMGKTGGANLLREND